MSLKILLFIQIIFLTLSLKEIEEEQESIYKSMTELDPPLKIDGCQIKLTNKDTKEKTIYVKSCNKTFHCGNEINDVSTCIPNFSLQKFGEPCNYDEECELGHCDSNLKKCTFDKKDSPKYFEDEEIYRCGNGLVYSYKSEKCVDKENIDQLKDFCRYTKNDENSEEVYVESDKPFWVCGEAGYATNENYPFLKNNSPYIKMTKVGSLKIGQKTSSEFACETGSTTKSKDDDEFWICDRMIRIVESGINDKGKRYVVYEYEIAKEVTITEDDYYQYYSYRNILNGSITPYGPEYHEVFNKYIQSVVKYGWNCGSNSHDYYFSPFDCGIQQIYDAYYYIFHIYFYNNSTTEAKFVMDALKNQEFGKKISPEPNASNFLRFKIFNILLFMIFTLF